MKNKKGNIVTFSIFIVAGIIVIFMFVIGIFVSEVNSIVYNIKLDMYSINKSAIIAVNKGITSRESFSYNERAYEEYFKNMIKTNYKLDKNLENKNGLIQKVKIKEYEVYQKGKRDNYTKKRVEDNIIHSVIEVKIKPILFEKMLEDLFVFEIHEDVTLNLLIEQGI